jgi:hypothetical protein
VERVREYALEMVEDSQVALLYIQASPQSCLALQRATRRIRRNVRRNDVVLLRGTLCIILLVATQAEGAQAVARRVYALLADVEFEIQIMYDRAAFALVQRLQNEQPFVVVDERETIWKPVAVTPYGTDQSSLPYLAFLASYPALRLLHLFPYELAQRHRCVPVGEQGLISHFHNVTQHNIFQVRCEAEMIEDVLKYWKNTLCCQAEKSHEQPI